MGPIKYPKMVVGATAKDVDMLESKANSEGKPARGSRAGGEGRIGPTACRMPLVSSLTSDLLPIAIWRPM